MLKVLRSTGCIQDSGCYPSRPMGYDGRVEVGLQKLVFMRSSLPTPKNSPNTCLDDIFSLTRRLLMWKSPCMTLNCNKPRRLFQSGVPFLRVPILRIVIFQALEGVPLFLEPHD